MKNFHLVNLTRSHIYFPYVLLDMGITSYSHPRVSHYLIFLVLKFQVFSCSWIWGITSYSQSMSLSFFNFVGFKLSSFLHLSPVSDPLLSRATATTCSFLSYMAIAMQSHRHTLPPPQSSLSPPLSHSFVHHHQKGMSHLNLYHND